MTLLRPFLKRHIHGNDGAWQNLYADTKRLANTQNNEPTKPRTIGRQMHRDNLPGDTPELYWKSSVFYLLLDHLATEIEAILLKKATDLIEPQLL